MPLPPAGKRGARAQGWRAALCLPCLGWLTQTVTGVRAEFRGGVPLVGAPSPGRPLLAGVRQCHICREDPGAHPATIEARLDGGGEPPWVALAVCQACAAWVGSLAASGTSARGLSTRAADGVYGRWLHPNLRAARVAVRTTDAAARAVILDTCREMEVPVSRDRPGAGSVAFFDADEDVAAVRGWAGAGVQAVAVVPFGHEAELRAVLAAGARDWVTSPVTPQQVTAALVRALRAGPAPQFDSATCLPRVLSPAPLPAALVADPAPGVRPAELAWLLKRFARGYDDLAVVEGRILVLPRAPEGNIGRVARRLEALLAGKCSFASLPAGTLPGQRFEATG